MRLSRRYLSELWERAVSKEFSVEEVYELRKFVSYFGIERYPDFAKIREGEIGCLYEDHLGDVIPTVRIIKASDAKEG